MSFVAPVHSTRSVKGLNSSLLVDDRSATPGRSMEQLDSRRSRQATTAPKWGQVMMSVHPPPQEGLLPKEWTGAAEFLRQYPQFDGRGIVVGVLDTGVDPGAPGLLKTTDGKTKVIDIVDCTGGGDVDTSTVVTEGEDGKIVGLSGRTLDLGDGIRALNAGKDYHLGVKRAFELFPNSLVARLKRERKKAWIEEHRKHVASVMAKISECAANRQKAETTAERLQREELEAQLAQLKAFEKDYKDPGPVYDCVVFNDGTSWRAVVDTTEQGALSSCTLLENYRIRQKYAKIGEDDLLNYGVNIYNNGNVLSIVVDAGYHGTHVAGTIAANFPDNPEVNGVAPGAQIVSLKIGDIRLGSMETHQGLVRAITHLMPADDGDNSEDAHKINCDLLNMSFGETTAIADYGRFVTLATELVEKYNVMFVCSAGNSGPGLSTLSAPGGTTSALTAVGAYVTPEMATQAYSFIDEDFYQGNEDLSTENSDFKSEAERFAEPMSELEIEEEPTDGHPQNGTQSIQLPDAESKLGKESARGVFGVPYTWCSRGPAPNGALGMNICAPGGAIAPVPVWTLRKKMLLNGTSMAAPSAAGAIALLMSFMKAKRLPFTPIRLQRAVENTTRPLLLRNLGPGGDQLDEADPFGTGCGSVHVPSAAEYLAQASKTDEDDLRFSLTYTSSNGETMKGVYLRNLAETSRPRRFNVTLEAHKYDDDTSEGKALLAKMEMHMLLHSSKPWVKVPKSIVLMGGGRNFPLAVDASGLEPGIAHFAWVTGWKMTKTPEIGPLFRFPVTIIKPLLSRNQDGLSEASVSLGKVLFAPGEVFRRFVHVPGGASTATLKITTSEKFSDGHFSKAIAETRKIMIQVVQIRKDLNLRETKQSFYETLSPGTVVQEHFCVESNQTLEICITQYWFSSGYTNVEDVEVTFGGLRPASKEMFVPAGYSCSSRLIIENGMNTDIPPQLPTLCEPKAFLTHLERALPPIKSTIQVMSARDRLPKSRQLYQLILTYNFSLSDQADVKIRFPGLTGFVYESEIEGGPFHMVLNSNKYLCMVGDCYSSTKKLSKGKNYVIRASVRHDDASILENLRSLNAMLVIKLGSEATLDCYATQQGALLNLPDKKVKTAWDDEVAQGETRCLYIAGPKKTMVPKFAQPGDMLTGVISIDKWSASNRGWLKYAKKPPKKSSGLSAGPVPTYPLTWCLGPSTNNSSTSNSTGNGTPSKERKKALEEDPVEKDTLDRLKSYLKDRKLSNFDTLSQRALAEKPESLQLLSLRLERLEECSSEEPDRSLDEILQAADAVIAKIDRKELAATLCLSTDQDDDDEVQQQEEADKKRSILCQALLRKLRVLLKQLEQLEGKPDEADKAKASAGTFHDVFKELRRWNETKSTTSSEDMALVTSERERLRRRFGSSLKASASAVKAVSVSRELLNARRKVLVELGWMHIVDLNDRYRIIKYPKAFPLF